MQDALGERLGTVEVCLRRSGHGANVTEFTSPLPGDFETGPMPPHEPITVTLQRIRDELAALHGELAEQWKVLFDIRSDIAEIRMYLEGRDAP